MKWNKIKWYEIIFNQMKKLNFKIINLFKQYLKSKLYFVKMSLETKYQVSCQLYVKQNILWTLIMMAKLF